MRPKDQVFQNAKYEKWLRQKPCYVCGNPEAEFHHIFHARRNVFMGMMLCIPHHRPNFPDSYHHLEKNRFEDRHGLDLNNVIINQLCNYIEENK